ncbi:MAG TPA: pyridoxamine 5'-phosphate oxidase [Ignavibacteria bacterium]|nr:pyridoxamine 5'-phosphate oxidase [Ignavibacteria bacterium]
MKFSQITKKDLQNKSVRQLVANFRNEYISDGINEKDILKDPVQQFDKWFSEAVTDKIVEPNVMHLSTVGKNGRPSGRIVLLKGYDENGFVFYTNYDSRKGEELKLNNFASLTFLWLELYRQVRIEGKVTPVSAEESDNYFISRPKGSQIGAMASAQSRILESRETLEKTAQELEKKYRDEPVPRPENWGGYCLKPDYIEFWQGRANRLHDRIIYTLINNSEWKIERLFP